MDLVVMVYSQDELGWGGWYNGGGGGGGGCSSSYSCSSSKSDSSGCIYSSIGGRSEPVNVYYCILYSIQKYYTLYY